MVDAHHATRGAIPVRGVVDGAPAQFYCLDDWSRAEGLVAQSEFLPKPQSNKILIKSKRCIYVYLYI